MKLPLIYSSLLAQQEGHVLPFCKFFSTKKGIRPSKPARDPFVTAVKCFAVCLLAIGSYRIYPYVGEMTLAHSVGLLDADDPFFVRIGLRRLDQTIITESGAKRVIEAFCVPKCLTLLNSDTDKKMIPMILTVFEQLSVFESSRPVLKQEGVLERIDRGIEEGWIDTDTCGPQLKTLRWELTRH